MNSAPPLRCFIAVPLPFRIKKELAGLQRALKTGGIKARWPAPSGLHLTLSFLGQVFPDTIPAVETAMAGAAAETDCFDLTLGALGVFPRLDKVRVLWVGLNGGAGELKELCQRLVYRLKKTGLAVTGKKFSPHITLARIKAPVSGRHLQGVMDQLPYPAENMFQVQCIHLYESRLTRSGAVHTCLCRSALSGFCG